MIGLVLKLPGSFCSHTEYIKWVSG
jgi:hypothetical protein